MFRPVALSALIACAGVFAQAEEISVPELISVGQGEYADRIRIGMHWTDVVVTVAPSGVRVSVKPTLGRCEYVADPETGDLYVTEENGECDGSQLSVSLRDKQLTFRLNPEDDPITVPFVSGEMGEGWRSNVPIVARIRGIELGAPMPETVSEIEGYTSLRDMGQLERAARTSFGMAGFTRTNFFDNATYLHASAPRDIGGGLTLSLDDLGVYGVDDAVVAVLRRSEPPAEEAPRYDAVETSLKRTYGEPSVFRRSGRGAVYEWHFDETGALLPAGQTRDCESRFSGDASNSREVFLNRQETSTSLVEIMQGRRPRIQDVQERRGLRVNATCDFAIRYHIHSSAEGLLEYMVASMYAYDPVRSEIWSTRIDRVDREIANDLELQKRSRLNQPEL